MPMCTQRAENIEKLNAGDDHGLLVWVREYPNKSSLDDIKV